MGAKTFFGQPCFHICLFFFFLGEVVAVTGLKKFQVYLFGVQNGQVQGQEILGNLKATRMDQRSEWKGDLPLRKGAIGSFPFSFVNVDSSLLSDVLEEAVRSDETGGSDTRTISNVS